MQRTRSAIHLSVSKASPPLMSIQSFMEAEYWWLTLLAILELYVCWSSDIQRLLHHKIALSISMKHSFEPGIIYNFIKVVQMNV